MDIIFPLDKGQRYYKIHYQYVLDLFMHTGCNVSFEHIAEPTNTSFHCLIDGKSVLFDFGDSSDFQDSKHSCFKFHQIQKKDNVFPFPPVSFYDWDSYITSDYIYSCNNDVILYNQKPYGDSIDRRNLVKSLLSNHYSNKLDTNIINQNAYFQKIDNCLVSVHVPGYCNNMLDRAQLQLMGLGCCTISPCIPDMLTDYMTFVPDVHYIKCNDNYSDLISTIEWCKQNRSRCVQIGENAKKHFQRYCSPSAVVDWVETNV